MSNEMKDWMEDQRYNRDKFLTEAMGETWFCHEVSCGIKYTGDKSEFIMTKNQANNFLKWDDFGKLLKWVKKQEWFNEFIDSLDWDSMVKYKGASVTKDMSPFKTELKPQRMNYLNIDIIDPDKFSFEVYYYLIGE